MSKTFRPVIAVTGPDQGGWPAWQCIRLGIILSGGTARRVTPGNASLPPRLDGVILSGGADIHPSRYQESLAHEFKKEIKKSPGATLKFIFASAVWLLRRISGKVNTSAGIDEARDLLEWSVLETALKRGIPILGICRGSQLINVFFGGSLHQDILSFYTEVPYLRTIRARKWIQVTPQSRLASALESRKARVNSLHRQAVNRLGQGLQVTAQEDTGVIQAIERPEARFLVGVQWHPEFLLFHQSQRRLFRHFVEAAAEKFSAAHTL